MADILTNVGAGEVIGKNGEAVKELNSNVQYIGLYFSAHWCPPCRGFTPKLAQYYNDVKDKGLEIIFISSDRDEASWKEYYGEMPWLALQFSSREAKDALSQKYGIRGIPTLVILNKDGSTKTMNGRALVDKNAASKELNFDE